MFDRFRGTIGLRPPIIYVAGDKVHAAQREIIDLARVVIVPAGRHGGVCLRHVLGNLHNVQGVKAVMVEGGASVLASFINEGTADYIIVTVAPLFIGGEGVRITRTTTSPQLDKPTWTVVGNDVILSGACTRQDDHI
jgi:riboflavin biosynthesis pyrimidine reductase